MTIQTELEDPTDTTTDVTQNPSAGDTNPQSGPSEIRSGYQPGYSGRVEDESLTDVVAALVSAVLALTFLLLIVCVIRVIKKRRRQRQGQRLNQPVVPTVSSSAFSANVAAYSNQIPASGRMRWERVDGADPSTNATSSRTNRPPQSQNSGGSLYPGLSQFQSNMPVTTVLPLTSQRSPSVPHSSPLSSAQGREVLSASSMNAEQQQQQVRLNHPQIKQSSSSACIQIVQVNALLHNIPSTSSDNQTGTNHQADGTVKASPKTLKDHEQHITGATTVSNSPSLPSLPPPPVFSSPCHTFPHNTDKMTDDMAVGSSVCDGKTCNNSSSTQLSAHQQRSS